MSLKGNIINEFTINAVLDLSVALCVIKVYLYVSFSVPYELPYYRYLIGEKYSDIIAIYLAYELLAVAALASFLFRVAPLIRNKSKK